MGNLRIIKTDTIICDMTQDTYDNYVRWEGDEQPETFYPFNGKGWTPPSDPVSGKREYMLEIDWDGVEALLDGEDYDLIGSNAKLVLKKLVEHKAEIQDNLFLMWESERTADNFKKVYCDLCMQKIYLEDFPKNWSGLEPDERYAYMNKQTKTGDLNTLFGWRETDGPVEEWVTICKGCLSTS